MLQFCTLCGDVYQLIHNLRYGDAPGCLLRGTIKNGAYETALCSPALALRSASMLSNSGHIVGVKKVPLSAWSDSFTRLPKQYGQLRTSALNRMARGDAPSKHSEKKGGSLQRLTLGPYIYSVQLLVSGVWLGS